jgi:hypothetical protein
MLRKHFLMASRKKTDIQKNEGRRLFWLDPDEQLCIGDGAWLLYIS